MVEGTQRAVTPYLRSVLQGAAVGLVGAALYGGLAWLRPSYLNPLTLYLGPRWIVASLVMTTIVALGAMLGCAGCLIRRTAKRESELGIAACFVGAAMLLLHLDVVAAVRLGVVDNQGILYALGIPLIVNWIGVPIGLVLALVGFFQPNRNRRFAALGLGLTLVAPVAFVLFLALKTSLLR